MKDLKEMTEQELRESEVPRMESLEDLNNYINNLVEREHDYGTCVYAMSMSAVAAFNYVASKLGVTGFQASCADLDILKRTRMLKSGFAIVDFDKLVYPQYSDSVFGFWQYIEKYIKTVGERAKELIEKDGRRAHPEVLAHWKKLVSMYEKSQETN